MKAVKYILKDSLLGELFTLWTAPIDGEKLDVSSPKLAKKRFIAHNLIIAHKTDLPIRQFNAEQHTIF